MLDQTCPKKKRSTKVKANLWYNKNLKEMAKRIKKAYKLSKRILGEAHLHYKKLVKRYKKLCKKRRRSSWRKYKETRQSVTEMVQLSNIIQKKRKNKINTFTKLDGSSSEPGRETLDILICLLYTSPSPRD